MHYLLKIKTEVLEAVFSTEMWQAEDNQCLSLNTESQWFYTLWKYFKIKKKYFSADKTLGNLFPEQVSQNKYYRNFFGEKEHDSGCKEEIKEELER